MNRKGAGPIADTTKIMTTKTDAAVEEGAITGTVGKVNETFQTKKKKSKESIFGKKGIKSPIKFIINPFKRRMTVKLSK